MRRSMAISIVSMASFAADYVFAASIPYFWGRGWKSAAAACLFLLLNGMVGRVVVAITEARP